MQPDIQYIINPGATTAFGNTLVLGARFTVKF
ncbi:MAG: carbohydrate porin [Spartobacteria bacterium]